MNRDDHLCWFHGKLPRESADALIKQANEDGTFLVRESSTAAGDFVLTLLYQGEVCHYQIRRHGEDAFFSIDDKVKILHGLDTLVDFYQQASNGLVSKLTVPIKKDPPPNNTRSHGVTNLLHRATKQNEIIVVSEMLKCGYRNLDAKNQDGQTALHLAALHCDETILKLLLDAGVNVNSMDTFGNQPLHYACRSKPAAFIRILIDANANVQGRNIKNGYVPLHEAAQHGNLDAVKELLAAQAPHLPRSNMGEFPFDLAKEAQQSEVATFLINYRLPAANTTKEQWYHGTLLREEAVEALMKHAADIEQQSTPEKTNDNVCDEAAAAISADDNDGAAKSVDTSGCFLVRYSDNRNAAGYVLTLLWNKQPKNFRISQAILLDNKSSNTSNSSTSSTNEMKTQASLQKNLTKYLYIDDGPYWPTLEHLIEHFMRFSYGLPCSLKYPVPPKPKPQPPSFSTMPRSGHKKSISEDVAVGASNATIATTNNEQIRKHSMCQTVDKPPYPAPTTPAAAAATTTQTLGFRKAKQSTSVFNTLKLRNPKKSMFDMNSLRKSKPKTKRRDSESSCNHSNSNADELKNAEPMLKSLSFSTEFSNFSLDTVEPTNTTTTSSEQEQEFYNVPKNNAAVTNSTNVTTDTNSRGTPPPPLSPSPTLPSLEFENKTEVEVAYFTQSDVAIERERAEMAAAAIATNNYDSNSSSSIIDTNTNRINNMAALNANGYLPTVDLRVFLDPFVGDETAMEACAAELREFSNHPERLDSLISTVSTESEMARYFQRQWSTASCAPGTPVITGGDTLKLNYFIPHECLELDAIIGEGEFGSVFKGSLRRRNSETGQEVRCEVAIKTLRDEHCRSNKQEFLREASVMIRLQHHCIVQLIGISKGESLMMVQEIVSLGSMLHYILDNKHKINPNYELKLWASQIACGMKYLESHHFVHRDLAARNILLASRNQAKISDFGLSRALGTGNDCYQASQGGKWPIKWYAPESFNNGIFSHASDVWSFGVTLWEMFTLGEPPYGDIRGVDAIQLIESGQRLPQPQLCPDDVYEIMKNCWNYKPKDRPTFRYLTDYFVKNPDYQNIVELVETVHIS